MPRIYLLIAALGVTASLNVLAKAQTVPGSATPATAAVVARSSGPANSNPGTEPKLSPEAAAAERNEYMNELLAQIAGHELEPADKVFKNIRRFKDLNAQHLLQMMNFGFGSALGVSCTHCHTPGEWEKESKPQKQIAREMYEVTDRLKKELLPQIKDLDPDGIKFFGCMTCHHGEAKPGAAARASRKAAAAAAAAEKH